MSIVDGHLVDRVRQKLDAGILPREHPKNVWRSYGIGDACNAGPKRPERPGIMKEVSTLIVRMATENPGGVTAGSKAR